MGGASFGSIKTLAHDICCIFKSKETSQVNLMHFLLQKQLLWKAQLKPLFC